MHKIGDIITLPAGTHKIFTAATQFEIVGINLDTWTIKPAGWPREKEMDAIIAEAKEEERRNWPYFRLMRGVRENGEQIVVAELQPFDEADYDHGRYLTERKFDTKREALDFARNAYNHPNCPDQIRAWLLPLVGVNIDHLFESE